MRTQMRLMALVVTLGLLLTACGPSAAPAPTAAPAKPAEAAKPTEAALIVALVKTGALLEHLRDRVERQQYGQ